MKHVFTTIKDVIELFNQIFDKTIMDVSKPFHTLQVKFHNLLITLIKANPQQASIIYVPTFTGAEYIIYKKLIVGGESTTIDFGVYDFTKNVYQKFSHTFDSEKIIKVSIDSGIEIVSDVEIVYSNDCIYIFKWDIMNMVYSYLYNQLSSNLTNFKLHSDGNFSLTGKTFNRNQRLFWHLTNYKLVLTKIEPLSILSGIFTKNLAALPTISLFTAVAPGTTGSDIKTIEISTINPNASIVWLTKEKDIMNTVIDALNSIKTNYTDTKYHHVYTQLPSMAENYKVVCDNLYRGF